MSAARDGGAVAAVRALAGVTVVGAVATATTARHRLAMSPAGATPARARCMP
jgi:hypothetical protein